MVLDPQKSRTNTGIPGSGPKVTISRLDSSDQGTFGVLQIENLKLFTGELPNRSNQPNVSCIPTGTYLCLWTFSPRFKRHLYEVTNVPNRNGIRIHSANLMGDDTKGFKRQLNGCIALGEKLGVIDRQKAVLLSKPAIRQFEAALGGKPFILEIK